MGPKSFPVAPAAQQIVPDGKVLAAQYDYKLSAITEANRSWNFMLAQDRRATALRKQSPTFSNLGSPLDATGPSLNE